MLFYLPASICGTQKSTEGFLTADVSSAALQRAGWGGLRGLDVVREGGADRARWNGKRRVAGGVKSDGARHTAEDLHEAWAERMVVSICGCVFSQQLVYLFNPSSPSLPHSLSSRPESSSRDVWEEASGWDEEPP